MVVCRNGHQIVPGSGPCRTCGAGLRVLYCQDGHANTTTGVTECSRCGGPVSTEHLSPGDRAKEEARKRGRALGFAAFLISWLLNDAVLSLLKIVIKANLDNPYAQAEQDPMIGFSADGIWVSLIIAIFVGMIVASEVTSDLTPVRGFSGRRIIKWWSSFSAIILGGVGVYHAVWLFQNGLGLTF